MGLYKSMTLKFTEKIWATEQLMGSEIIQIPTEQANISICRIILYISSQVEKFSILVKEYWKAIQL